MKDWFDKENVARYLDTCFQRLERFLSDNELDWTPEEFIQDMEAVGALESVPSEECFDAGVAVGIAHGMARALGMSFAQLLEQVGDVGMPWLHELILAEDLDREFHGTRT